jgi:hypothetical protein
MIRGRRLPPLKREVFLRKLSVNKHTRCTRRKMDIPSLFLSDSNVRRMGAKAMYGLGSISHLTTHQLRQSMERELMMALQSVPPVPGLEMYGTHNSEAYREAVAAAVQTMSDAVVRQVRVRVEMKTAELDYLQQGVVAWDQLPPFAANVSVRRVPYVFSSNPNTQQQQIDLLPLPTFAREAPRQIDYRRDL